MSFPKNLKFFEKFEIFPKVKFFQKIEIFSNSWDLSKKLRSFQKVEIFSKNLRVKGEIFQQKKKFLTWVDSKNLRKKQEIFGEWLPNDYISSSILRQKPRPSHFKKRRIAFLLYFYYKIRAAATYVLKSRRHSRRVFSTTKSFIGSFIFGYTAKFAHLMNLCIAFAWPLHVLQACMLWNPDFIHAQYHQPRKIASVALLFAPRSQILRKRWAEKVQGMFIESWGEWYVFFVWVCIYLYTHSHTDMNMCVYISIYVCVYIHI